MASSGPDDEAIARVRTEVEAYVRSMAEQEAETLQHSLTADDDPALGPLLRFHLLAERVMGRLFEATFPRPDHLRKVRLNFAQKIALAAALGSIPDSVVEGMRRVNSLRNQCAHVHGHRITREDIEAIGPLDARYAASLEVSPDNLRELMTLTLVPVYTPFLIAVLTAETLENLKREGRLP